MIGQLLGDNTVKEIDPVQIVDSQGVSYIQKIPDHYMLIVSDKVKKDLIVSRLNPDNLRKGISGSKAETATKRVSKEGCSSRVKNLNGGMSRTNNSFIMYRIDKKRDIVMRNPMINQKVVSKICADMWRSESDEVRQMYRNRYLIQRDIDKKTRNLSENIRQNKSESKSSNPYYCQFGMFQTSINNENWSKCKASQSSKTKKSGSVPLSYLHSFSSAAAPDTENKSKNKSKYIKMELESCSTLSSDNKLTPIPSGICNYAHKAAMAMSTMSDTDPLIDDEAHIRNSNSLASYADADISDDVYASYLSDSDTLSLKNSPLSVMKSMFESDAKSSEFPPLTDNHPDQNSMFSIFANPGTSLQNAHHQQPAGHLLNLHPLATYSGDLYLNEGFQSATPLLTSLSVFNGYIEKN
ncbi:Silenced mating-type M-specific polypeptide Mc [Smittium culicis]|uniref:Silenced mating-type M-specific polypeptide Mc n=1 Tax=Smittium culicis TaxID=133412 RepID=A0A1R1XYT0_9FUNG|nr:Silenced mating-type M-specific polypeptide Mc [Smittium culicis]